MYVVLVRLCSVGPTVVSPIWDSLPRSISVQPYTNRLRPLPSLSYPHIVTFFVSKARYARQLGA